MGDLKCVMGVQNFEAKTKPNININFLYQFEKCFGAKGMDYENPRKGDWKGRGPTDSPKSKVRRLWLRPVPDSLTVLSIESGFALLLPLPIKNIHLLVSVDLKVLLPICYLFTFNGLE